MRANRAVEGGGGSGHVSVFIHYDGGRCDHSNDEQLFVGPFTIG
jgi:hypothetical protein